MFILFTYFIAQQQQSQQSIVPKIKKDVNKHGNDSGDLNEDSATGLYTLTWRDYPIGTTDVLIIGSFGEVSDSQTIQVAHKLVLNDHENLWMTKEIDLIKDIYKEDQRCQHNIISVCSDLPGNERSKNYYLEKIRNFFTDCKQDGGK